MAFDQAPSPGISTGVKAIFGVIGGGAMVAVAAALGDKQAVIIIVVGILAVGLLLLAYRAILGLAAKRRARPLTADIAGNGRARPREITEAQRLAKLAALQEKFQEGLDKFQAAGKDLYTLPWYVLVGESGSGKTQLMVHCKVGSPEGFQDELAGAGGTLNMNWWFTNHAIILDTAGRLMFEEVAPGATNEWNEFLRQRVEETVEDPETAERLKAYYRTGCKRLGFSDDFLPTFNRPNVRLVDTSTTPIVRMTPKGIIVGGEEIEVDCIIYATGFVQGASWTDKAGYDVVGRHGELLSAKFKDGMQTFFGILSHGFPNFFFLGLTQVGASANFVRWIVEEGEFLGELITSLTERGIERIEATAEAEEDWCRQMDAQLNAKAAFLSNCTPGYYNNESKVTDRRNTFSSGLYLPGGEYFARLHEWRDTGEIDGVVLTPSDQSTTDGLSEVAG